MMLTDTSIKARPADMLTGAYLNFLEVLHGEVAPRVGGIETPRLIYSST